MGGHFHEISRILQPQEHIVTGKSEHNLDGKNGRKSCTDNYRHIDINHLFVKDIVDKGEIQIQYI